MLLRTSPVQPGADSAEPSAARFIRRANQTGLRNQHALPALDPAALSARYGGDAAYRPRLRKATFRVPLGASSEAFRKEQARIVWRWINRMLTDGWDWCQELGVRIYPGHYPAYDCDERGISVAVLDCREFIAEASFKQRAPKHVRTEIRPELLVPVDVRWAGASSAPGGRTRRE